MKLKSLVIAMCCLIISLLSETQCMDCSIPCIEEGNLYKIINRNSENCLNTYGNKTGRNAIGMQECLQNRFENHRLWSFKKVGEFYNIINEYNGNCLNTHGIGSGKNTVMERCLQDSNLWSIKKVGNFYNIIKNDTGHCLNAYGAITTGINTIGMEKCLQNQFENHRLWSIEKVGDFYQRTCPPQLRIYEKQLYRYELFGSSFISGAVDSLIPEFSRDFLVSRGYTIQQSNIAATVIQGGAIFCTTSYFSTTPITIHTVIPMITGIVVRSGCIYLGFSPQNSSIAGSTSAIITSVAQNLIFSQETAIDCMLGCAISMAGSYVGSTLALKLL